MIGKALQHIEFITLNIASFGWIVLDIIHATPNWLTTLIGLSIVFFNVARGIAVLKKPKDNADK